MGSKWVAMGWDGFGHDLEPVEVGGADGFGRVGGGGGAGVGRRRHFAQPRLEVELGPAAAVQLRQVQHVRRRLVVRLLRRGHEAKKKNRRQSVGETKQDSEEEEMGKTR